jgi:glycosyltransferase involved in cell wall biosynthesis
MSYMRIATLPPVVIVIPAYNEVENIKAVLEAIPSRICGLEAAPIVIDDGSDDGTFETVVKSGHRAYRNLVNHGGGAALRKGLDIARRRGARIIVTMDADGQHRPEEIPRLVAPILADKCAVVIGSRVLGVESASLTRRVGLRVFNFIIRLLTGVPITDCASGFRAFHAGVLSRLTLRQNQYHTAEFIIKAARERIPIIDIPISARPRASGASKKSCNLIYGLGFAKTVLAAWWR